MIVVTGGAGFIGSNLVKGLNDRGTQDILIVDNLSDSTKHKNMNRLKFSDYIDYRNFPECLYDYEDIKIIFHLGACADTTGTDGVYMMEKNYDYSKGLLNYCMETGTRLIYASSASVYGMGENGFKEEESAEYPLNIYAFSKYQFDRFVRMSKACSQVVGLRYFNVYGPQENHKGRMASVAYKLFRQVKAKEPLTLFEGSESFTRDFIHVDDVVKVNLFFMDNPDISGIFNTGTGVSESFKSVADAVEAFYPGVEVKEVPFPDDLKGKYQKYTCADLTKLREVGYKGSFLSVSEGVKRYMEVLENTGGYII